MLSVERLTVSYGHDVVVHEVDLEVGDGEIVSVLGPSGSGKSSMLRAIAGLAPDAHGTIAWDGRDLAAVPPHRRNFGLMFQDHALFPHRDVRANVAFGLRMQRLPRATVDERARLALERVGLAGFDDRPVAALSGGEQQRVALARALAPEPSLLMLDEPFGALDRALRDHLVGELRALFTELALSVIFVTHDHDEAFALGDRLLVMHDGRVVQVGEPLEVWRRPASAFVARFLGWNVTSAFDGRKRAIRPEDFTVAPVGAFSDTGDVRGTVITRTFRRDHHLVTVALDDREPASDLRVTVPIDVQPPEIGARVAVFASRDAGIDLTP
jgi:thiamine transport system ATP-binding protein